MATDLAGADLSVDVGLLSDAVLQVRDVGGALSQHGLLLLERKLQLQVLLAGSLTLQAGAVEPLLQRRHLRREEQGRILASQD